MSLPNGLPTLSRGQHRPGDGEACAMEYVSIIAGLEFTDSPRCTHSTIVPLVWYINDHIQDDALRAETLMPFLHRLANCPTVEGGDQAIGDVLRRYEPRANWPAYDEGSMWYTSPDRQMQHLLTGVGSEETDQDRIDNGVKFLVECLDALDALRDTPAPEPYSPEFVATLEDLVLAGEVA